MKVSEYVKKLRTDKNARIIDYCKELNISHTQLTKIENGYMDNPTPLMAVRLCKILDIEPIDLKQFDFKPSKEFIDIVSKKLTEQDPIDAELALNTFVKELLPVIYPKDKYGKLIFNTNKYINKKGFEPSIFSTQYDGLINNKTKKREAYIHHIPTRTIRKFSYKYDSLCKNLPDFISKFTDSLVYSHAHKYSEVYFVTTSKSIYTEIENCFPHQFYINDIYIYFCYIDLKNANNHNWKTLGSDPKGR